MGTVLLAVIPPIFFLIWILRYDRIEPEPFSSVLKILILGCVSIFPVAALEVALLSLPLFGHQGFAGAALQSFLVIAPVEEAAKLLVVMLFVWKSRHFDEPNDGIVYAGTASIGFALAENLFYVFEHGTAVGMARAVTSIPGHTFTGILMGYFLGRAKFSSTSRERGKLIIQGFLAAWLLHGLYDSFVLSGTSAAVMVIPLLILNFIIGIRILRKGRALSAGSSGHRTGERSEEPARVNGCMKIAGRILLVLSALFWILIALGLFLGDPGGYRKTDVLYGSVIITFLPVTIGLLIEISSRKRNRPGADRISE